MIFYFPEFEYMFDRIKEGWNKRNWRRYLFLLQGEGENIGIEFVIDEILTQNLSHTSKQKYHRIVTLSGICSAL